MKKLTAFLLTLCLAFAFFSLPAVAAAETVEVGNLIFTLASNQEYLLDENLFTPRQPGDKATAGIIFLKLPASTGESTLNNSFAKIQQQTIVSNAKGTEKATSSYKDYTLLGEKVEFEEFQLSSGTTWSVGTITDNEYIYSFLFYGNCTSSERKELLTKFLDSTSESTPELSLADQVLLERGKINALKSANSYLAYSAFSRDGLVDQLEYEKYTHEQAVYAADSCGADWNEQAALCAKKYLDYTAFSRAGLIEQLQYEGFTYQQAVYGVEQNGY